MSGREEPSPPKCGCSNDVIFPDPSFSRCCSKQRLWWMLHSQKLCDISFVVGPDSQTETFHAHRSVLSAGSSVFESMFSGNWAAESSIRVPDVESSAFSILLRYIYTDDVLLTAEVVLQVLYAAKKYEICILELRCSQFLKKNLCSNNAFTLLMQAKLLSEDSLAESCLKMIDKNAEEALSFEDFLAIDFPTLCELLKRDTVKVKETTLFDAVVRWAAAECGRKGLEVTRENQRSLLEGALPFIRFPLMTQKEFTTLVAESGLLNDRELVEMFYYFSGCPKASLMYNRSPRSPCSPNNH
ncbi:BTB/POZ domain-containing protein 2 [Bemisia tabaci]|uniref:BTB/POZ domain-containing protein 2 n=1 Tax=Bemisia tabaci TaxID=7038 RepID=UPI003B285CA6